MIIRSRLTRSNSTIRIYWLLSELCHNLFSGALDALIKWSEMTEEELAWESGLSEKTIQRLRNQEPDSVTIETVVQLCIGMQLPPQLSSILMRCWNHRI